MPKRKPARAQAIRCAAEALERIRLGETVTTIYDELVGHGEIDMAYRTFAHWMKRFGENPRLLPDPSKSNGSHAGPLERHRGSQSSSSHGQSKLPQTPDEPFIGSIGVAPSIWPPRRDKGALKRLMGEDQKEC